MIHYKTFGATLLTEVAKEHAEKNTKIVKAALEKAKKAGKYKRQLLFLEKNLNIILSGDVSELVKVIDRFNKLLRNTGASLYTKEQPLKSTKLGSIIKNIFKYDTWQKKDTTKKWIKEKIKIPICPYCNRAFTTIIQCKRKKKYYSLLQLDHFYCKVKYPYLSLSFFNLIPSCANCNAVFKGCDEFTHETHLHPYTASFDECMIFKTDIRDTNIFYGKTPEFKLELVAKPDVDSKIKIKAEKNIEDFRLNDVYESHKDYVVDLIRNRMVYDDEAIKDIIKEKHQGLFETDLSYQQAVEGMHRTDGIETRVLGKLSKDIAKEYNLRKPT